MILFYSMEHVFLACSFFFEVVMVTLNGKEIQLPQKKLLLEFLKEEGFNLERIVVEFNGNILPKKEWSNTWVFEDASIEVLSFVGGG